MRRVWRNENCGGWRTAAVDLNCTKVDGLSYSGVIQKSPGRMITHVHPPAGGEGTSPGAQLVRDCISSVDGARVGTRRLNRRCGRLRRPCRTNQPLKTIQERADDSQRPEKTGRHAP